MSQWLKGFEDAFKFSAVFSGEREQRLARIANWDAEQLTSHFDLLGVAAAFHVTKQGQEFIHVIAGGDKVVGEGGFEDVVMLEGRAGGSAADPTGGAPEEVVERLIVGAADHLIAVAEAQVHFINAGHVAGGFLDADDVIVFGETVHHFVADFGARAPGEVVKDDGNLDSFGDGGIMREQLALVRT